MAFTLRPSTLLRGLVQHVSEVLCEDLLALEVGLRSRLRDLRDDLPALEARLKAHNEALVEETRAVLLREMRAEFTARLGGGTTSAPSELPRLPRFVEGTTPAGLPPGRYHP